MFKIGYKRMLEEDDMYEVLVEDRSKSLGQRLHRLEEPFKKIIFLHVINYHSALSQHPV